MLVNRIKIIEQLILKYSLIIIMLEYVKVARPIKAYALFCSY